MNPVVPSREGTLAFHDYKVWYRIVGEETAGKLPLLLLHGGPGACHDYLEPLEALAARGRRVILYDQLGCGNSDHPHNPALWTVELFKEELATVRQALGLSRLHLLGQSWGGMLAMEYALTRPQGLASLTLASTLASSWRWAQEAARLKSELPQEVQETLRTHESAGTMGDPAYAAAEAVYYHRHVCRIDPYPACVARSFAKLAENPEVYYTMWGRSEFVITGTLKDWDIEPRLTEISVPTLITSGRYDEATPAVVAPIHGAISGSEWVLFEHSAHMSHVEEADRYLQVLDAFLTRVEALHA